MCLSKLSCISPTSRLAAYLVSYRNQVIRDSQKGFFSGVEPDLYQLLVQRAAQIGPDVGLNDLLCCDKFDVLSDIDRISLPTEIISGSLDKLTPVKFSDYLASKIENAEGYVVKGGDHFMQLQHHKEVNGRIERFLQRVK